MNQAAMPKNFNYCMSVNIESVITMNNKFKQWKIKLW